MADSDVNASAAAQQEELPLPPATFDFFVLSLKTNAEMAMGLLHFGEEKDRPTPDLRIARHTIDLLGMIHEKTKGNLSYDELRFRFVQVSEAQANKQ
jgi:hypothetical protein